MRLVRSVVYILHFEESLLVAAAVVAVLLGVLLAEKVEGEAD